LTIGNLFRRELRGSITGNLSILIPTILPPLFVLPLVLLTNIDIWIRGTLSYSAFILLPGITIYEVLRRKSIVRSTLIELVLYANALGISLVTAVSWTLARFGWLTYQNVIIAQAGLLFVIIGLMFRGKADRVSRALQNKLEDAGFLGIIVGVSAVFLVPKIEIMVSGSIASGDDSIIARLGQIAFLTKSWPNLSQVLHPYLSEADIAPGGPLLFGILGSSGSVNPIFLSPFFMTLALVSSTIAMSVLADRFNHHPVVKYGLPIAWLLGFEGAPFLFNLALTFAGQGGTPESLLSIPLLLALVTCLVDLTLEESITNLALPATLLSGIMLLSQLTFLMALPILLFFGLVLLRTRGLLFFLKGSTIIALFITILAPTYLGVASALGNSPAFSVPREQANSVYSSIATNPLTAIASLGIVGTILAFAGAIMPFLGAGSSLQNPTRSKNALISVALAGIAIVYGALSFTPIGALLLGISPIRFLEYIPLVMMPLVADALHRISRLVPIRSFPLIPIFVLVLILASSYLGASYNMRAVSNDISQSTVFNSWHLQGASWLSQNAPHGVVVADANNSSGNVVSLFNFCKQPVVIRDSGLDYQDIFGTPHPFNLPYYYANLVLTNPNSANLYNAYKMMGYNYYFLEIPYDNKEIQAFSVLPYMSLVYSNPGVDIFQYTGSNRGSSFLFQATDYDKASNGIQAQYSGYGALNASVSFPSFPNAVSSNAPSGASFDGNYTNYLMDIQQAGNYSIYLHRDVNQASEYLLVSINGITRGAVFFTGQGWNFGSTLSAYLPVGQVELTLTFEGTVGWADPVDYIVVVPNLT